MSGMVVWLSTNTVTLRAAFAAAAVISPTLDAEASDRGGTSVMTL
jgi:hypothetical protein